MAHQSGCPILKLSSANAASSAWVACPITLRTLANNIGKRRARRKAIGIRTPILVEARGNARWLLDFVHDQLACGRRFRILNIVDDMTRECLVAIPDTPISGRRVARDLTRLVERRGRPGMSVGDRVIGAQLVRESMATGMVLTSKAILK